jgi:hypothetical protein
VNNRNRSTNTEIYNKSAHYSIIKYNDVIHSPFCVNLNLERVEEAKNTFTASDDTLRGTVVVNNNFKNILLQ